MIVSGLLTAPCGDFGKSADVGRSGGIGSHIWLTIYLILRGRVAGLKSGPALAAGVAGARKRRARSSRNPMPRARLFRRLRGGTRSVPSICLPENISTPNLSYAAQYLACALPCERFTSALADNPCITRGQCGSLLLHRDGLPPSTSCRSPGAPVHHINDGSRALFDHLIGGASRRKRERLPHCLLGEIAMTIGWSLSVSSSELTLVGVWTGSTPVVGS